MRYGALDQYGMGLRTASEVPPFFMLEAMTDMEGRPVMIRLRPRRALQGHAGSI